MVKIVKLLCFPEFRKFIACNGFLVVIARPWFERLRLRVDMLPTRSCGWVASEASEVHIAEVCSHHAPQALVNSMVRLWTTRTGVLLRLVSRKQRTKSSTSGTNKKPPT
eukprot:6478618-Amphidinium_carterae.1